MSGQINFGSTDLSQGFTEGSVYVDGISVALGRTVANGTRPIRVTELYGYVSGRGASRTITMSLGSGTSSFTVGSASSAQATGWKAISAYYSNGGTARFQYTGSGSFYFARGGGGTSVGSFGNFAGTLGGSYKYVEGPSAPGTPTVTKGTATGSVNVSWTAPTDDGGTGITGYRLERSTSSTFASGITATTVTGTSTTITGLTPGTTYYFRVAARNIVTDAYSTWSTFSGTRSFLVASGGEVWNGSAFVAAQTVEVWNGSAWVAAVTVEVWNGSAWVAAA